MGLPTLPRRPRSWWVAEALLTSEALVLATAGFYLNATAPETETLGRGTVGVFLIVWAATLALLGLLGLRRPGVAGTVLLVIGVPVLVGFLQGDLSTTFLLAYGAIIAIPPVAGLLFALGSLDRSSAGGPGEASSTPASSSETLKR
jgi:hypothetical protein